MSRRERPRRLRRTRRAALVLLGLAALAVAVVVVGYVRTDIPAPNAGSEAAATRVMYADGGELGRIGKSNRIIVAPTDISDPAQKAVLAAEDRGYYSEPGISPRGIARALLTNIRGGGGVQQGGSTITQQYVKNVYLTSERTYRRKVKEVFLALKLSRTRPKDEVLGDYLNTIYFGRGADGIEVAARTYFGVAAKDLTAAQGAVLASSIRSPAGYDPARHPQAARDRWAYVLDGMVTKGWLSPAERAGQRYPTVLRPGQGKAPTPNDRSGPQGYVLDRVEQELKDRAGISEAEVASSGYVVTTTIRRTAQDAAVKAVADGVPAAGSGNAKPVGALVSVVPGDGAVVAYVGGTTGNGGTDYAGDETFLRQPGSSFKPYVLATALGAGTGLDSRFDGSSPQKICGQTVRNDAGDGPLGQTDLVKGLALSVNTVYFRLACDVGPRKVADLAHAAGIPAGVALHEPGSATVGAGIALGVYGVHVIDQAAGYATFAAQGQRAEPYFVQKVTRADGGTRYRVRPTTTKAFSKGVAADATYAMQQVVKNGTGLLAQLDGRPVAGKTGTTQNNVDAWFCGFTPQLATAVWVGRPDQKPLKGVPGFKGGISGGKLSAKIFKAYMDPALKGQPVQDLPARADVGTVQNPAPVVPTAVPSTFAAPPSAQTQPPSAAPTSAASTSAAPTTAAPTSAAPTSAAPSTAAPSTAAPSTAAPTSAAPSTVAPSTAGSSRSPSVSKPPGPPSRSAPPPTSAPASASAPAG